jgi:hypothetical protein
MEWKDIAGKIADAAPTLGTLIGGPIGTGIGTGVKLLARAFGLSDDATPDQIDEAIKQDPQAALKLRQAELEYNLEIGRQKLQETQQYLADVQSARNMAVETTKATGKRDIYLYVLASVIVGGFFGLVGILIFRSVPQDASGVIFTLFGSLAAGFGAVISYFFGSSKGSVDKTELLAKGSVK